MYYDLHVKTDNLKETLRLAKELGLSGLGIILDYDKDFPKNLEKLKNNLKVLKPKLDIALGVEIEASAGKVKRLARSLRKKVELILVSGGDPAVNRAALEAPEVDVLTHPGLGRRDPGLDHVMASLAAKNSVSIEFSFNELLYAYKKSRAQVLQNLLAIAKLVNKYKSPFILSSGAQAPWDLRSPSELTALGRILGLKDPGIKQALSNKIVSENRRRLGGKWVMPGVEVE